MTVTLRWLYVDDDQAIIVFFTLKCKFDIQIALYASWMVALLFFFKDLPIK